MAQEVFRHIIDAVSLGIRKDNSRITPFSISKTSQEKNQELETLTKKI